MSIKNTERNNNNNMLDIFKIMNEIDDDSSLSSTRSTRKSLKLSEDYKVSYGRGANSIKFDDLDAAIDHINNGMKNRSSETFVLYNNNDEMIWIDRYTERDGSDLGYSVSRQKDKSVVFDKEKGLETAPVKYDDSWKKMIVNEVGNKMKQINLAPKFAKFNYLVDKSNPSHIDFDKNVIYCNPNESLPDIANKLVKEYKSNAAANESLRT